MNSNGKVSTSLVSEETLYTPDEVAEILGISAAKAYFLIGREIPFILRRRCRLVRQKDLEEYATSPAAMTLKPKRQRQKQAQLVTDWFPGTGNGPITKRLEAIEAMAGPGSPVTQYHPPDVPDKKVERPAPAPYSKPSGTLSDIVIVTKIPVITAWLARHGITGQLIERPNSNDIRGKHVIAHILPHFLAIQAQSISWVDLHGVDLSTATADDMDSAGAELVTVSMQRTPTPPGLKFTR